MARLAVLIGGVLLLGACAETQFLVHTAKRVNRAEDESAAGGTYKVGNPYQVNGVWYYPAVDYEYDETGIASWYGDQFHGKQTANGEVFDMNAITAAHKTLPLPSIVRVTNLENGRSLTLRVNDRGPFVNGRIIDLSRRSAQLLGLERQGTARVRVQVMVRESQLLARKVDPSAGGAQVAQIDTGPVQVEAIAKPDVTAENLPPVSGSQVAKAPPAKVGPAPQPSAAASSALEVASADAPVGTVTTVPVGTTRMYIQAGAFAVYDNANRVRARLLPLGAVDISPVLVAGRNLFRVRMGPIASVPEADGILDQVIEAGFPHAKIIVD